MSAKPTQQVPRPRSTIAILGVPFDCVTMDGTLKLIEGMVESRKPHYLATANVDFTVQAQEDEELRRILFNADLVVCDGMPLVWASRWLGNRLPERVAGSDMVPLLLRLAAEKGYRVFFLGGREDVIQRAIENVTQLHPGLCIAGAYSPPFAPLQAMDHKGICERIRAAKTDILFVSFGCPKQEKWIAMNYRALGVPVSVGVGATIDFLAGEVARAPGWMQRTGLEWVFRLLQEPRRLFRRYVKGFWVFGRALFKQWWKLRPRGKASPVQSSPDCPPGIEEAAHIMEFPERLDAAAVASSSALWSTLAATGMRILADASRVAFVDSTGIGALIRLERTARSHGGSMVLVAPSIAVDRALDLMRLRSLFTIQPGFEAPPCQEFCSPGAAPVAVRTIRDAESPRIAWSGEVTAATVDAVWSRTAVLLDAQGEPGSALVIDLAGVSYVDSAGLGLMVRVRRVADRHGFTVRFLNATVPVARVLKLARLEEILVGGAA